MTRIIVAGLVFFVWICLLLVARRLWRRWSKVGWGPEELLPLWLKRVVLVFVLIALPGTAVVVISPFATCVGGGIDVGIARYDDECVGVTDGRYRFSGDLAEKNVGDETRKRLDRIEDLIRGQNEIQDDFVKVAFLTPLTSPLSGPRAVDELEGVAAAQRWINQDGRGSPKIQLLIAHMGSVEKQWKPVVRQLIAMKDDRVPLVAVVGLGLSQVETGLAAKELAAAGVPMVASSLTATELDPGNRIEGFHQVSHTNEQQVDTLFQYLRNSGVDLRNAVVVQSEDESDTYTSSYAEAIKGRLAQDQGDAPVPRPFGDPDGDPGKLGNQFRLISQSLCRDRNVVVFYAGRSRFLSNFIQKLDGEACLDSALVVSASDAAVLRMRSGDNTAQQNWGIDTLGDVLKRGKVSLLYTTSADLDLLGDRPKFQELVQTFHDMGLSQDDLRTRWAIMGWDALRVVAEWVWRAQPAAAPDLPRAADVTRTSAQIFTSSGDPYEGASGDFWFDGKGNRRGEPPQVVQLLGDGSILECPCPSGR